MAHLSVRDDQKGISLPTLLVFLALFGSAFYYLYKVLPFYYGYYELQNQMEAAANHADELDDKKILKLLTDTIKWQEIPVDPANISLERQGQRVHLKLSYREVFYITLFGKDYDLQTFDFLAEAETRG